MKPLERFTYRAARLDGTIELGTVDAGSREGALTLLGDRGLFPLEVAPRAMAAATRARLPLADLALGLRVLANLLEAGMPMSRALAAFADIAPASWAPGLEPLRDQVREGQTLATALQRSPLGIPPLVVGIVQAGEAGSGVAGAVRSAAELMESTAATRAAIRGALTYPVILAFAGVGAVALLVGVVLPRFAAILADLGQALPPTTRMVLGAATLARAAALPALVALVLVALLWRSWTAGEAGRAAWHGWLLRLPVLGTVRRAAATARAAAAASALLESGVPVAAALRHAARASGDAALQERILAAREHVVTGQGIARALGDADALTQTAVRLVRAGEESGRLAELLEHAARIERERAQELTRGAVRLLEPGIIIVFGGLVALVAAALLQAVYAVRPT